ncbi:hypothetical protein N0V85_007821 [Neurospora sp. IMI 360204]|nr:hypothetical protein N0V85_007821 [Neurospora sp. IMI 360204]
MSQPQSGPDPDPESSIYQQVHTQVLNQVGSTPDLSEKERTLYILDLVRFAIAAWQASGLTSLRKGMVSCAIASLGDTKAWKAKREEWLEFTRAGLGVQVSERVIAAEDTEMTEKVTEKVTTEMVKKGGEGDGVGNKKGKRPAKRRRVGDDEEEGGDKVEEAEEAEEDEEDEEADRISWKQILAGLQLVEMEMNGMKMVSPDNFPLIRSSLELVEYRLEHMKEVFVPLLSRINNTLLDEKGVGQKLAAMEKGLPSNRDDKEGGGEEASETFKVFSLEYKSLVANLVALDKMFVEHGIPAYVSPFYSTEEKLDSMEDMLVSEMESMMLNGRPATTEVQSRFKPVMEKLAILEKMFSAATQNPAMQKSSRTL